MKSFFKYVFRNYGCSRLFYFGCAFMLIFIISLLILILFGDYVETYLLNEAMIISFSASCIFLLLLVIKIVRYLSLKKNGTKIMANIEIINSKNRKFHSISEFKKFNDLYKNEIGREPKIYSIKLNYYHNKQFMNRILYFENVNLSSLNVKNENQVEIFCHNSKSRLVTIEY